MEDDKLKQLFSDFNPPLSDDGLFMSRLESRLDSVELVRRQHAVLRRRRTIAVAISAVAGFVTGVIFTLLLPYIASAAADIKLSFAATSFVFKAADNYLFPATLFMAAASAFVVLNTYELSLWALKRYDMAG